MAPFAAVRPRPVANRVWASVEPFAFHADYVDADCFAAPGPPLVVPARTLLSQLV